jgi:hypothetical protein
VIHVVKTRYIRKKTGFFVQKHINITSLVKANFASEMLLFLFLKSNLSLVYSYSIQKVTHWIFTETIISSAAIWQ